MKDCSICGILKDLSEFYSQEKVTKDGEEYTYYRPDCKECTKKSNFERQINNPERRRKYVHKYNNSDKGRRLFRNYAKKYRGDGRYKEWQNKNKDKIQVYNKVRRQYKEHDIAEQEWLDCLEFFNDSCAYCGISEADALKQYNHLLHKEHVEHYGANDITNCVPACRVCNSSKHLFDLNEWYYEGNPIYSKRRYNKIIKWLLSFTELKDSD